MGNNGKRKKRTRNNNSNRKNTEYKKKNEELEKTKKYNSGNKKNNKNKKDKRQKNGKKKRHIFRKIIITLFLLGLILCMVAAGIVAGIFFSDKFKLTEEELTITNVNGYVKDKDGNVIATLSGKENRKIVTFDDMPEYLPKAFVAIEDKRFYEHNGIDIKRTAYVTIMYAINKGSASSGGGSTITQQLIKNLMDDDADEGAAGIERKIREMARAYNLEKILYKDQILELYLNKIPMGSTIYGVGMAAEYYFNKPLKDLDLAECAFLAGINHGPSGYNPFIGLDNETKIKDRTKEVLSQMLEQGKITNREEYDAAVQKVEAGLPFSQGANVSKATYSYHTSAAIKEVVQDLMNEKGVNKETAEFMVENSGYVIYTTQDTTIQHRMEEEFLKDKYIKSGRKKDNAGNLINAHTQAAMVIMDHKTGKVVATVGGLGSDSNSTGWNRATQGEKQTGSSIKPLACIAPALESGLINPGTVYDDSATSFGNYAPHNSSHYSGLITIRTALKESSNIVHVKIMRELGPANAIKFLSTLGIEVPSKHEAITLALGTADVSVLNMTAAYASIANNGQYIEPTFYTKVEDSKGNVVLQTKQETRRVMSEANAYVLQNLLTSPARSGTAAVCAMSNMDVGAKTGSTNGYVDRWLCGFTPYYTAATWFGFDESEPPVYSTNNAANIWAAVMKDIHSSLPTARFQRPSNVVYAKICEDSGKVATDSCTRTISEVFVKGTIPGQCEGHEKILICKQTGKIATEDCKDVEEKVFVKKPEKENTNLWKTDEGDKYNIPTETCNIHFKEKVEMPNVIGKTLEVAKKTLENNGLLVKVEYSEDKSKNEGIVLKQSVKEKEKVEKGSTITITINKKQNTNVNTNTIVNETTNTISGSTQSNTNNTATTGNNT